MAGLSRSIPAIGSNENPDTPFVASFVGENNMLKGRVTGVEDGIAMLDTELGTMRGRATPGLAAGAAAMLFVRPENVEVGDTLQTDNLVAAKPIRRDMEGAFVNWVLSAGDRSITAHLSKTADAGVDQSRATKIGFSASAAIVMASGELADTGRQDDEAAA